MNVNHLKYFRDAASSRSLSSAARRNRVSQSAISQAIVSLERQLDCKLVFHKRNRFQLTEAGQSVLRESRQVFESLERLQEKASRKEKELTGELAFGCVDSVASSLLAPALIAFQRNFPNVQIKIRHGDGGAIRKWIEDREIDLGFVADETSLGDFNAKVVARGKYRLFRSTKSRTTLEKSGVIVNRKERPEVESLLAHFRRRTGTNLRIQLEATSWEVIQRLVLTGMGIGLCPDYVIQEDLKKRRLVTVNLASWRQDYQVHAISLKNRELPKASRLLLELVTAAR